MSTVTTKLAELGIEPTVGEAFAPLSKSDLDTLESAIGHRLPEAYRRFLRTYGSSTFGVMINCTPDAEPLYFGSFFGRDELLVAIGLEDALPETIIPIGDDGGGNTFCLGVSGRDKGKVYFHHHCLGWHADAEYYEQRGEPVPADIRYQTVHLIASSFDEFILQMAKEEDE